MTLDQQRCLWQVFPNSTRARPLCQHLGNLLVSRPLGTLEGRPALGILKAGIRTAPQQEPYRLDIPDRRRFAQRRVPLKKKVQLEGREGQVNLSHEQKGILLPCEAPWHLNN